MKIGSNFCKFLVFGLSIGFFVYEPVVCASLEQLFVQKKIDKKKDLQSNDSMTLIKKLRSAQLIAIMKKHPIKSILVGVSTIITVIMFSLGIYQVYDNWHYIKLILSGAQDGGY